MDSEKVEAEINKYKKFKKVDGATYRKVNQFLRKRTYITAREWALARLCTDFRTSGGAEMTFIGKHLPELVPFMEESYSPQAVNQARNSFKKKVRKSSATFFYGAMCGFFTTDELDDLLFEASEVARFLLEVEGTTLDIDEEIDIEDRITRVMRSVGEAAKTILRSRAENSDLQVCHAQAIAPTLQLVKAEGIMIPPTPLTKTEDLHQSENRETDGEVLSQPQLSVVLIHSQQPEKDTTTSTDSNTELSPLSSSNLSKDGEKQDRGAEKTESGDPEFYQDGAFEPGMEKSPEDNSGGNRS